ncbi:hypothetical protein DZB84_14800 [Bacillus sp. HNG]|uniref:hypothetical protein n=1 Tax=Bacillus sp. HNG TaxID=2293325 RepID=UPI000E2EFA21|nr:hypothetical protein [Bacillus sp. HNG]RFB14712.1 hypothetical protein DZB84_14800 [Bacillus sp. HNG]
MSLIGDIKSIAEVVQKADNIELYGKILNLQAEAMDMTQKLNELKEENKALKEKLETKGKLTFKNQMYFLDEDSEPFCSSCWDVKSKLVRLHGDGESWFQCPSCKTVVNNTEYNTSSSGYSDFFG